MSDKQPGPQGRYSALPGIASVALEGRDALAFAQAQFMSDVAALTPGHWHWSGWLTPKGRVIALFALLRHSEQHLQALVLDADAAEFAARLQRFVFRSKVTLRVDGEAAAVSGAFSPPTGAAAARFAILGEGTFECDMGTPDAPRTLRVGTPGEPDDAAALAWRLADLAHGLPRLPATQAEAWTPQQLSLERLKAYSVKKGCYPGQEIVARTHFLGQAKRGLVRLVADADMSEGDVFAAVAPDRALGQVVSRAGREALAVMPLDAGEGPFVVAGVECTPLPLRDGLAR